MTTAVMATLLVTVDEKEDFEVEFSGSTYEDLLKAIKEELPSDLLSPGQDIANLQILSKKFSKFVYLNPKKVETIVKDGSELKVTLTATEPAPTVFPVPIKKVGADTPDGSNKIDQSENVTRPVVTYCTEPLDEELTMDTGDSGSSATGQGGAAAYALESKLWVGRDRLFVYFLNHEVLKDEGWMCGKGQLNTGNILGWAAAWNIPKCRDIPDFQPTDRQDTADIRIKFQGGGCWSKVGRSAEQVKDKSEPTMVLSLKDYPENEQKFLVIHEFGHALGLLHEHQRHNFWEVASTVLDVAKMKEDHRMKNVDFERDILATLPSGVTTEYDPDSVMHYWFDVTWLKNREHWDLDKVESGGKLTEEQKEILRGIHKRNNSHASSPSERDLDFLQQLYAPPSDEDPDPHIELPSSIHNTLYAAAYSARSAWKEIGLALSMEDNDLSAISMDNQKTVGKCFNDMLIQWLHSTKNCYLDTFLRALRSPQVNRVHLCAPVKEAVLKELNYKSKAGHKRKRSSTHASHEGPGTKQGKW